jgi:hypothetical protein
MVPLDSTYIADANHTPAPLIAATYTDHDGLKTGYLFAFNRHKTPNDQMQFTPAQLGLSDAPAYVYDAASGTGQSLDQGASFSAPLGAGANAFYVVAPVGKSGIAFLGDKGKFVGTGKQRISSLTDEAGKLTIGVLLAENEKEITLHGFAASAPTAAVYSGLDDPIQYNPVTHYFTVEVKPDANTPVDRSTADPVRHVTVILQTAK